MNTPFTHGGNIYQGRKKWLDFSANINPLGLARSVRQAIENHIDGVIHYPDPDGTALKDAISAFYGVPTDAILLGNGAAELLYTYFHARPGQRVAVPAPTFSEYERAALAGKGTVCHIRTRCDDGFAVPWQEFTDALGEMDIVIFTNPNNPTGRLIPQAALLQLIHQAREHGTMILVDESFLDFREDREAYTVMPYVKDYENLMVLQSLTKFFALPGLRLGFAVMAPALRHELEGHKDVWNVNVLAQYAGVAALLDTAYQAQSRRYVAQEKEYLQQSLQALGQLTVYNPSVNFMLLHLDNPWGTGSEVQDGLRHQGILVRNCANYVGLDDSYIRIAVRRHDENERLLQALGRYKKGRLL